jgi:endogenous inhibitor of DNA gyrase (YacG/DUF329 family)
MATAMQQLEELKSLLKSSIAQGTSANHVNNQVDMLMGMAFMLGQVYASELGKVEQVTQVKQVRKVNASMTTVNCKWCKNNFQARSADVKRGWGIFCSKQCKAMEQESRTGQYANLRNTANRSESYYFDERGWDDHHAYVESESDVF